MKEKVKILNTNEKESGETNTSLVYPHISPHKNPNQFNGEYVDIQHFNYKNNTKKKVAIETYGCI